MAKITLRVSEGERDLVQAQRAQKQAQRKQELKKLREKAKEEKRKLKEAKLLQKRNVLVADAAEQIARAMKRVPAIDIKKTFELAMEKMEKREDVQKLREEEGVRREKRKAAENARREEREASEKRRRDLEATEQYFKDLRKQDEVDMRIHGRTFSQVD